MPGLLKRLFFPTACPLCGTLDSRAAVEADGCCERCRVKYLYSGSGSGISIPDFAPFCGEVFCCSYYGGAVRRAMLRYKFSEDTYIGACFGKILYRVLQENHVFDRADLIAAVPVSAERFQSRGYNQSFFMARTAAALSGLPLADLLERKVQGRAQSELLSAERRSAGRGKFALREGGEEVVRGKSVLLIDDILTTGSTMNSCARLLHEGGAAWVIGACMTGGRRDFT